MDTFMDKLAQKLNAQEMIRRIPRLMPKRWIS